MEAVTGERFEGVVKRLAFDPLGLASSTYWPWEVMTERFAVGHLGEGADARVARPWPVGRSAHPAGGIASTTRDLLRYARVGLTWYGEDRFGTIQPGGGTLGQISLLVLRPATGRSPS